MTITESIRRIVDSKIAVQVVVAKIEKVHEAKMTADIEIEGGAKRFDVRLRATIEDDKGFVVVPKTGSYVLAGLIDNKMASSFICAVSEVDYVLLKGGKIKIENQGEDLKGLIGELIDAISQITVPTGTGPSGMPINAAQIALIKNRLNNILK
jgi:hypothetical protein